MRGSDFRLFSSELPRRCSEEYGSSVCLRFSESYGSATTANRSVVKSEDKVVPQTHLVSHLQSPPAVLRSLQPLVSPVSSPSTSLPSAARHTTAAVGGQGVAAVVEDKAKAAVSSAPSEQSAA